MREAPLAGGDGSTGAVRVTCLAADSGAAEVLAELVAGVAPGIAVDSGTFDVAGALPEGQLLVIDAGSDPVRAVNTLLATRARGAAGRTVLLAQDLPPEQRVLLSRQGDVDVIPAGALGTALPNVIAALPAAAALPALLVDALRESRQLLAAGALARKVQHDLNNPLAALLAEAQLLEMESLLPEHREAVERIVALCRRVISVSRALDGPSGVARTEL
jgi:signal transduction histidine kinase